MAAAPHSPSGSGASAAAASLERLSLSDADAGRSGTSAVPQDSPAGAQSASPFMDPDDVSLPPSPHLEPTSPRGISVISSLAASPCLGFGRGSISGPSGATQQAAVLHSVPSMLSLEREAHEILAARGGSSRSSVSSLVGQSDAQPVPTRSARSSVHSLVEQPEAQAASPTHEVGHVINPSLVQMLSMVGSRFVEAECGGLLDAEDGGATQEEGAMQGLDAAAVREQTRLYAGLDSDAEEDSAALREPTAAPRFAGFARSARRHGVLSELIDDSATPKGGHTPLGASLAGIGGGTIRSGKPGVRRASALGGADATASGSSGTLARSSAPLSDHEGEGDGEESASDMAASAESLSALQGGGSAASSTSLPASQHGRTTDLGASMHMLSSAVLDPPSGRRSGSASPETIADPQADVLTAQTSHEALEAKLRSLYSLDANETLLAVHPAWLMRSVLLQGHLYLTSGHLLFYAYLPSRGEGVLKTGPLRKRTKRTLRFSRHWAVLRGRALSWYDSERDPYFPQDHIDLRSVLSVEATNDASSSSTDAEAGHAEFLVHTPYRVFTFSADSAASRDAWVRTLLKAVLTAQNEGESVRICVPLETIVDVDAADNGTSASALNAGVKAAVPGLAEEVRDASDVVCVKVVDGAADDFAVDEYYFLHLIEQHAFLKSLREAIEQHVTIDAQPAALERPTPSVRDSTSSLRTLHAAPGSAAPHSTMAKPPSLDAARHEGSQPLPIADTRKSEGLAYTLPSSFTPGSAESHKTMLAVTPNERATTLPTEPTYPPWSPARSRTAAAALERSGANTTGAPWSVAAPLPAWVREAGGRLLAAAPGAETLAALARRPRRKVRESWSRPPQPGVIEGERQVAAEAEQQWTRSRDGSDGSVQRSASSSFAVLDAPDAEANDADYEAQFRASFVLPEDEELLCHISASLYRVLPVTGRLFISTHYVCFRSSRMASKTVGRTLMILPVRELVSVARNNAFRFGQHGLVLMIRGHEELFLEFSSAERRDYCLSVINARTESVRAQAPSEENDAQPRVGHSKLAQEREDALLLTDLGQRLNWAASRQAIASGASSAASSVSEPLAQQQIDGLTFQSSASSTFLSLRPPSKLHFTFLTIGSRGDVQPFLALARGLKSEGHDVRIATHGEFKSWIEGHGVEFREVGGDPAELMRICVENGTFTVSFLREGVSKFRGWLDDLLASCWRACQGTDVIVESPSAIAGIHVAEALQVPYFRAFTMCWSRSRAYPHAFAVPNSKAGGNYNYMSYVIFDQVFWRASAGQINAWRKKMLGLRSTSLDRLEPHRVPFLYNFSPHVVPKPLDWYDWIQVTGYWFLDNPDGQQDKKYEPPVALVAFIERARAQNRKIVYIGWGSIVVQDAEATTRCVYEAVRRSGVCAVLSKGWSDRLSARKEAPSLESEDVFRVDSVPHDWLFPLLDAACHHGGAGTVGASLRAGLPTIVKPFFGDQFFWGAQIESLGVGSCVRHLTADALAHALTLATAPGSKQAERARALGEQIRREDGVANAISALYGSLDYARSLIKRDTRLPSAAPVKGATPLPAPSSVATAAAGKAASSAVASESLQHARLGSSSGDAGREGHHSTSSASASDAEWSVVGDEEQPSLEGSALLSPS